MPSLLTFPLIKDPRGNLSVAEHLPFDIRRVYWIHGVTPDAKRGGHTHKALQRVLIATSGSFDALVDGKRFELKHPWFGLYIAPMEWLDLENFSGGAVCMVLASETYDEADYIREKQ